MNSSKMIAGKVSAADYQQKQKMITVLNSPAFSYADALRYIENDIAQSKKMSTFRYRILCFRNDGVYQLNKAIQEIFGIAEAKNDDSPSGNSDIKTIDVTLADGTRHKVPYGQIALDGLGEDANIDISYNEDTNELFVRGKCQYRFATLIDDIIERTKELLSTESIFSCQALEIADLNEPKIMDLSNIDKELMVLSRSTEYELQPLKSRILHPETCIERGIPLKYGCLLEGSYGTGKTLLAFKLAKEAINNCWSFIYLKDPKLLAQVLRLSKVIDKSGHGIIVFVEDIDQVTRGNRDDAMQDILNTLDGGDTKGMNVITLFTTNHIELIEPTFLRGKRIGSVISMGYLDAETAESFIRQSFADGGYVINDNLTEVCNLIANSKIAPAFMAEIAESLKSKMIFSETNEVKAEYITHSVNSYLRQVALSQKKDMSETPEQKLSNALKEVIGLPEHKELLQQLREYID
ncbi:MAG: AAA family ATPase [Tannerellaceae bacterium]